MKTALFPKHHPKFSCQHVSTAATGELNLLTTVGILVPTTGTYEGVARHSSAKEQCRASQLSRAAPRVTVISSSRAVLAVSVFLLLSSGKSVGSS